MISKDKSLTAGKTCLPVYRLFLSLFFFSRRKEGLIKRSLRRALCASVKRRLLIHPSLHKMHRGSYTRRPLSPIREQGVGEAGLLGDEETLLLSHAFLWVIKSQDGRTFLIEIRGWILASA